MPKSLQLAIWQHLSREPIDESGNVVISLAWDGPRGWIQA